MKIRKLWITKEHINKATRCDSRKCPIAFALWDYFGDRYADIEVVSKVYLYKKTAHKMATFYTTSAMANFIRDFDAGKRVGPTVFVIDEELADEDY